MVRGGEEERVVADGDDVVAHPDGDGSGPAASESGGVVPEAREAGVVPEARESGGVVPEAREAGTVPEAREVDSPEEGDQDVPDVARLELEGEIAADYVEGLLDVADLDGDIDMDVEGDRAVVSVVGATLKELVGPRGEVLDALQELTRLAVHRQTGGRTRLMLDIGGYRAQRRAELAELGASVAEEVKRTGEAKALAAMNAFERKVVHDAIAAAGLRSESEGIDPNRRVVVLPVG